MFYFGYDRGCGNGHAALGWSSQSCPCYDCCRRLYFLSPTDRHTQNESKNCVERKRSIFSGNISFFKVLLYRLTAYLFNFILKFFYVYICNVYFTVVIFFGTYYKSISYCSILCIYECTKSNIKYLISYRCIFRKNAILLVQVLNYLKVICF